jgi:hypothetical protein
MAQYVIDGKVYNANDSSNATYGKLWGPGSAQWKANYSGQSVSNQQPTQQKPTQQPNYNQISQQRPQSSTNMQDINNIISALNNNYKPPEINRISKEEMMSQAANLANLQIDPLLQALSQGKENYVQGYGDSKRNIEAAYAGIGTERDRLMKQAQELGTESAIARGGGRSGAVEHGVGKMHEAVLSHAMQIEAEKAAKLTSLEEGMDLFLKQYGDKVADLEGRRGALTTAVFDQLSREDQMLALELARMAENKHGVDVQTTLGLLPYFTNTKLQDDSLALDWTRTMGQVPQYSPGEKVSMGSLDQIVGLRDYTEKSGINVGWDSSTGSVSIGNQSYSPTELEALGAKLVNDRWQVPQSVIDQILYGRGR